MIPQVFHAIWIQGVRERPSGDYLYTFLEHHPGWNLQIWDENSFKSRLWMCMDQKLRDLYDSLPHVVQKADVARIIILYHFGGIYVDLDFACLQPLELRYVQSSFFAVVEHDGIICNGIFGSVPKHPMLKVVLDEWRDHGIPPFITDKKQWILNSTGPHRISTLWRQHANKSGIVIEDDIQKFFPFSQAETRMYKDHNIEQISKMFPNALACHMYWGQW